MSLHRGPILRRQAAVGLESHHAVGVEQQDGRTRHVQTLGERIQRGTVDVVEVARATERARHGESHRELSIGGRWQPLTHRAPLPAYMARVMAAMRSPSLNGLAREGVSG